MQIYLDIIQVIKNIFFNHDLSDFVLIAHEEVLMRFSFR